MRIIRKALFSQMSLSAPSSEPQCFKPKFKVKFNRIYKLNFNNELNMPEKRAGLSHTEANLNMLTQTEVKFRLTESDQSSETRGATPF